MKKQICFFSLLMLLLLVWTGCGGRQSLETAEEADVIVSDPEDLSEEVPQGEPVDSVQETTTESGLEVGAVEPETKTVIDYGGNEVEMPYHIDRVATSGALNQMVLILGQPEKIVATAESVKTSFFATVYPGIKDVTAAYGGAGKGSLNMETLISTKPQVIFGGDEDQKALANSVGIISLEIGMTTPEDIKTTLGIVAQTLGDGAPEKAEAFCEYYDSNLAYVREATENAEKVRVFVASGDGSDGAISTIGRNDVHTSYIEAAGGVNIVAEDSELANESSPSVDFEYLIKAQPDVIIVTSRTAYDAIMSGSESINWQQIAAVRNGEVYVVPKGVYLWCVRSCEGALQPLFLASVLHPDLVTDLNLKQEVKDFYSNFYYYDLTDEEAEQILNQQI